MMYTPVETDRIYEKIVHQIEQRILSGDLKPGDRLPSERELVEHFHVSRTAVREAVKALHERGLVSIQPGRGTFITDDPTAGVRDSLGLLMRIRRSPGFVNLAEVREILEPEIAALASTRATDEHFAGMREAVEAMDRALGEAEAFIEADLDFHLALAEATQNTIIPVLIDSVVDLLREQRKQIFQVDGGPQRGQYHHKRILDAVMRRDPDAARAAMRDHLRQVREDSEASAKPKA